MGTTIKSEYDILSCSSRLGRSNHMSYLYGALTFLVRIPDHVGRLNSLAVFLNPTLQYVPEWSLSFVTQNIAHFPSFGNLNARLCKSDDPTVSVKKYGIVILFFGNAATSLVLTGSFDKRTTNEYSYSSTPLVRLYTTLTLYSQHSRTAKEKWNSFVKKRRPWQS